MKKRVIKPFAIFFAILLPLYFSCEEDKPSLPTNQEAPTIPPKSTFVMDFDDFTVTQKLDSKTSEESLAKPNTKLNWGWAVTNVAVWSTVITVTMIVPVAAFAESFNHDPVLQPNGSWLWSYDFVVSGITHTAKLYGKPQKEGVLWNMYITKNGFYSDFLWFTGFSDYLITNGYWTLNYQPTTPTPFLRIDWNRYMETGTADIKYTLIEPNNAENGSYIFFGSIPETPLNAFYDIYSVGQGNLVEIEWSQETNEGRIKDEKHFKNQDWQCWNANLDDVACN